MSIRISEEERLRIKCAHLEMVLAQERAQHAIRKAMESRDNTIDSIFKNHVPKGSLENYSFDLDTGVFSENKSSRTDGEQTTLGGLSLPGTVERNSVPARL